MNTENKKRLSIYLEPELAAFLHQDWRDNRRAEDTDPGAFILRHYAEARGYVRTGLLPEVAKILENILIHD